MFAISNADREVNKALRSNPPQTAIGLEKISSQKPPTGQLMPFAMAAHYSTYQVGELCLGDLNTSARNKSCMVTDQGAPIRVCIGRVHSPFTVPFHPSAYGESDAKRVGIVFRPAPDLVQWVAAVESACLAKLKADPERFKINPRTIDNLWMSSLKDTPTGMTFRGKLNIDGPHACRFWNVDGTAVAMPKDMAHSGVCAVITARQLWFSATSVGLQWEVNDILLVSSGFPTRSPWADEIQG